MKERRQYTFDGRCNILVEAKSGGFRRVRGLKFNGEEHTLKEWAEISGLPLSALTTRMHLGWSAEDILTTDVEIRGCVPPFIYKSKLRKEQNGDHI